MNALQRFFPTVNQYNIFLLIPVLFFCHALLVRINAKLKKRIYAAKNISKHYVYDKPAEQSGTKTKSFINGDLYINENLYINDNLFKKVDRMLRKQGYPFRLTASSYFLIKSALFLICFILSVNSYHSFTMALIIGLAGFYTVNVYMYLNRIIRDSAIKNDLLNVVDCLYLQMSAQVTLKDAMRGLYEVCKITDFRKALIRLSATYELSGLNIEKASDEFKDSFDILEINLFAVALNQQVASGFSLEVLNNLSETLKESYIERLNIYTGLKVLLITLGVAVVLFNITALTFFPIFVSVSQNVREIFK